MRPERIDLRRSFGARRFAAAALLIARFHKANNAHRLNRRTAQRFGAKLENGLDGRDRKLDS